MMTKEQTDTALATVAHLRRLLAEAARRTEDSGVTHRVYRQPETNEARIMTWAEAQPLKNWVIVWLPMSRRDLAL